MTNPTPTQKPKECCEKCSGRVEDEVGFSHSYGCQNEACSSCHQVAPGSLGDVAGLGDKITGVRYSCEHRTTDPITSKTKFKLCPSCDLFIPTPDPIEEMVESKIGEWQIKNSIELTLEQFQSLRTLLTRTAETARKEEREIVRKEEMEECNHNHKPDWNKLEKLAKECSDPIEEWERELAPTFTDYDSKDEGHEIAKGAIEQYWKQIKPQIEKYRTLWQAEAAEAARKEGEKIGQAKMNNSGRLLYQQGAKEERERIIKLIDPTSPSN